ncbi:MAG TPA: extracellular solute-binding protein [Chloroflexota bacterium]|nr:extracellular solute-binding protein [Chloroflexota bacterium]
MSKVLSFAIPLLALALAACGGGQAGVPAAQSSAASPAGASQAAPASNDWQQVVAAAKREGKIIVSGPPTDELQQVLTKEFEKRYPEINVDYISEPGGAVAPKVLPQRQAGQYLLDMVINGTTTELTLMGANALDPIPQYLDGPESANGAKWRGGNFEYSDNAGKYNMVFGGIVKTPLATNPSLAPAGSIKSYNDLLDPKWKNQMAIYDPRSAGASLATVTFFYTTPSLGKDFVSKLFAQNIKLSRDDRQVLDWTVRGDSAIAIAPSEKFAADFLDKGIKLNMMGGEDVKEGSYLTAGVASFGVLNRGPHPNAVKVYIDWLLSPEAQLAFTKAAGYSSFRSDVPTDFLPSYLVPKPGVQYQENHKQDFVEKKDEIIQFLSTVIK